MKRPTTLQDHGGTIRRAPALERSIDLHAGGRELHSLCASDHIVEAMFAVATGHPATGSAAAFAQRPDRLIGLLANACLHEAGIRLQGTTPASHVGQCLSAQGRTDFESRISNVVNAVALEAYESADPLFRLLAPQVVFDDFKPADFRRPSDLPTPRKVNEHGEFRYHSIAGGAFETIQAATYGALIGLTRPLWIDGRWDQIVDLVRGATARGVDALDRTFFELCIAPNSGLGPDLSDGNPVFDAGHANVVSAGALDLAKYGAAVALLKRAATPDGLALSLPPSVVLVAPEAESAVQALLAPIVDAQPEAQRITVRSSPHLTGTRFYVFTDPARFSNYRWGWAGPDQRPVVEQRSGFHSDSLDFKLRLDFAVGAVDSRAGVTGAGS